MNRDVPGDNASHYQEGGALTPPAETHRPSATAGNSAEAENGMEALLRDNEYAFRSLRRGETVEGTVVRVDPDEMLVDVGMKSEGVIPAREFYSETDDAPSLHVGDRALVYVMQPEGSDGHAILSLRRARMERSWRDIEDLYQRGAIIEAPVVDSNKGGLIVDVKGVRGFVPVSQVLDLRNVTRQEGENEEVTQTLAAMNGRRLPLKIIEINRSRNRLILSERAAVQEQRTQRKDELMDQLQPGQIRRGVVSNLTSFGAFVDLGGADGLVHVSEISYNRVNHPSEVLRVGQEIDVMVLSVDRETKKIALSLKKALPDPWTTVEQRYHVGQVVQAVITKLAKFGAFAKVEEGLEGLIHLSELTDQPVQDASQVVHEGQELNVKIIHINDQRRRLGLSVRQAQEPAGSGFGNYGSGSGSDLYGGEMQSFGAAEDGSSFRAEDLSAYGESTLMESTENADAESRTQEEQTSDPHAGELNSAAEFESGDPAHSATEAQSQAGASEDASSASNDASSQDEEPSEALYGTPTGSVTE